MTKLHIKSPSREGDFLPNKVITIFLAGAIDNGEAEQWQEEVYQGLGERKDLAIFNPRRNDWDANASDEFIINQIKWELEHIIKADAVIFYIPGNSRAPITLLELGFVLGMEKDVLVYCEPTYYRFLNVKTTCEVCKVPVITDKEELYRRLGSRNLLA